MQNRNLTHKKNKGHFIVSLVLFGVLSFGSMFGVWAISDWLYSEQTEIDTAISSGETRGMNGQVLGVTDEQGKVKAATSATEENSLVFRMRTIFDESVEFTQGIALDTFEVAGEFLVDGTARISGNLIVGEGYTLSADNVVYSLTGGDNVTITGDQDLLINIDPSVITQGLGIFNKFKFGDDTITASGNIDTLTFNTGTGISYSTDGQEVTITANGSALNVSGWEESGSSVILGAVGNNVGIGLTTPGYKLDVDGEFNLTDAIRSSGDAGTSSYLLTSSGGGAMTWTDPSNLSPWTNTSNVLHPAGNTAGVVDLIVGGNSTASANIHLQSNGQSYFAGNVGVGTTSPSGLLNIEGSATGKALTIINETGDQNVLEASVSGTSVFTVANDGNVGIGTTSPSEQLDITGNFNLPNTTSTTGQIKFGGTTMFHEYGTGNIFLGENSGNTTQTGTYNTAVGYHTLSNNTSGANNSAFGRLSLEDNTTGGYNSAFGTSSLSNNTTGTDNSAFGYGALSANSTGIYNTATGALALSVNTTGFGNVANGKNSLQYNTSGTGNVALGYIAASRNTTGSYNTALGYGALDKQIGGSYNNAVGNSAAIGFYGLSNFTGNNIVGAYAGYSLRDGGDYNVLMGHYTSRYLTSGAENVMLGTFAGYGVNSQGAQRGNIAVGYRAAYGIKTGADYNMIIGYQAAENLTTGSNNIMIGYDIDASSATADNQLNIGNLIFGTGLDGTGSTISSGSIGIGTNTPTAKLNVEGSATGKALTILNETGDQSVFEASVSGASVFTVANDGNVGIGNSAPIAKLDISGSIFTSDELSLHGASLNSAYGINIGSLSGGERGINVTSSAPTSQVYGSYFNVDNPGGSGANFGLYASQTGVTGNADFAGVYVKTDGGKAQGLYTDLTVGSGYYGYGSRHNVNGDSATIYGVANYLTGANSTLAGIYNFLTISGNGSGYGEYNAIYTTSDAISQTGYANYSSLNTYTGASDSLYGSYIVDGGASTGGTQTGLYIDLDDLDVTNYSIFVENGSGISYFGSNVGIGSSSPGYALDLVGEFNLTDAIRVAGDAGTSGYFLTSSAGGANTWTDPSSILSSGYWDNTLNVLHPKNEYASIVDLALGGTSTASANIHLQSNGQAYFAGNVGIGTVAPQGLLEVEGLILTEGTSNEVRFSHPSQIALGYIRNTASTFEIGNYGLAQEIVVTGGGYEFMRFASSGNIGINDSTPTSALDVNGTGHFTDILTLDGVAASTDNTVLVLNASNQIIKDEIDSRVWGTSLIDGSGTANYVTRFSDANTLSTGVLYDNATNVGIGTTNPLKKLHIEQGDVLVTQANDSSQAIVLDGTNFGGKLDLYYGASNLTTRISGDGNYSTYLSAGQSEGQNVGVGTTAPTAKLEVWIDDNTSVPGSRTGIYSYNTQISDHVDGRAAIGIYGRAHLRSDRTSAHSVAEVPIGIKAFAEVSKINAGTLTLNTLQGLYAGTLVDQAGATVTNVYSGYFAAPTETNSANIVNAYSIYAEGPTAGGTSNWAGYFNGDGYFAGNVGIGSTSPGQTLDVVGNARFSAVGSGTYSADLNLTADGTLTTSSSDERLKTNIVELDNVVVLNGILSLKPSSFDWIDGGISDIGLIAQDVAEIFPGITFTNKVDGYMGINYSRIPSLLISAIQEQQLQIESLNLLISEDGNLVNNRESSDTELNSLVTSQADENILVMDEIYNKLLEIDEAQRKRTQAVTISDLLVEIVRELNVKAITTFESSVIFLENITFKKDLNIQGKLTLSKDQVGKAVISIGNDRVYIKFLDDFSHEPIVTLTLASDSNVESYFVDEVTAGGFYIKVKSAITNDTQFNWHAFEGKDVEIFVSDPVIQLEEDLIVSINEEIAATESAQIDVAIIIESEVSTESAIID